MNYFKNRNRLFNVWQPFKKKSILINRDDKCQLMEIIDSEVPWTKKKITGAGPWSTVCNQARE